MQEGGPSSPLFVSAPMNWRRCGRTLDEIYRVIATGLVNVALAGRDDLVICCLQTPTPLRALLILFEIHALAFLGG
jgi:hypothetical protein